MRVTPVSVGIGVMQFIHSMYTIHIFDEEYQSFVCTTTERVVDLQEELELIL
jgi:hypothetical protein